LAWRSPSWRSKASCSTPQASQSRPRCNRSSWRRVKPKPARIICDKAVPWADNFRYSTPCGFPDASCAGAAWRSSTVTCQPRAARLAALALPARPAPITSAWRGPATGAGRAYQGVTMAGDGCPVYSPLITSHFLPMPGIFFMVKPASISPRRTHPVVVKVPSAVPGWASRANWPNSSGVHMSGFFAGAKPSRNHTSMLASSCGSCSSTSPISKVRVTRPSSKLNCWKPGCTATYWARKGSVKAAISGHKRAARAMSSRPSGYFSTLMKCRRASAWACSVNSCQAQKKFIPVPKPVSPITRQACGARAAKRCARRVCSRNT